MNNPSIYAVVISSSVMQTFRQKLIDAGWLPVENMSGVYRHPDGGEFHCYEYIREAKCFQWQIFADSGEMPKKGGDA